MCLQIKYAYKKSIALNKRIKEYKKKKKDRMDGSLQIV